MAPANESNPYRSPDHPGASSSADSGRWVQTGACPRCDGSSTRLSTALRYVFAIGSIFTGGPTLISSVLIALEADGRVLWLMYGAFVLLLSVAFLWAGVGYLREPKFKCEQCQHEFIA